MNFTLILFILILSTFFHYVVNKIFLQKLLFDDVNHRSSHKTLATRTGGIGVFLTLLTICLFFYFQKIDLFDYSLFIPIGIMFFLGLYDDLYQVNFKLKFFLQIIVAKILIDQGYVISDFNGFLGFYEVPWLVAQFTTVFVFLVIVNSINFIDGIDGLAITEVMKSIIIIEYFSESKLMISPLGFMVIFSLIPLYYFNFKKKGKIFLGDCGSLLLGTIIVIYIIYVLSPNYIFNSQFEFNKVVFAVLVIIYPLFDLLRVFTLRIINGRSPFIADQNHVHHFFFKKTNSHFKTLFIISFLSTLIFVVVFLITK